MTPRTFFREVKAAELRAEDRMKELTTQAWQANRIHFETKARKRMPSLRSLLEEIGSKGSRRGGGQTMAQLCAAMNMIASQHGLEIKKVPKHG